VRSKTQAIIRLAQIFEDYGLHATADIVDGSMWRIALDLSDVAPEHDASRLSEEEALEDIKTQVRDGFESLYGTKAIDESVNSVSDWGTSFWIMPDGSRIDLGYTHHDSSISNIIREQDLHDHPAYSKFMEYGSYKLMGMYFGALRVYYEGDKLSVTSNAQPTPAQMSSIEFLIEQIEPMIVKIEQEKLSERTGGHLGYDEYSSVADWRDAIFRKSKQTNFVKTVQDIEDISGTGSQLWKNIEMRNLIQRYPGDENAKFRRMYMRSASTRLANRNEYYKQALEAGHKEMFSVIEPDENTIEFHNMHSFWLYPDGRLMDLGKQWHEMAFDKVMHEKGLDTEEEFGNMYSSKDGPHEIMSDYFGMIRLFIQNKNILIVTSYRRPTQMQIDQIQNISQKSNRGVIKIEQYGYVNGGRLVTNSMSKWIEELDKYRPDSKGESSYNKMRNNIGEVEEDATNQPYWKARERQNLETTYPGPENEQLRKMYERSASYG
jgi:hypothetical protein